MSSSSLKDKQALFAVLDGLRRISDEADSVMSDDETLHRTTCRSFFASANKPTSSFIRRTPAPPRRTVSAPVQVQDATPQIIPATQESTIKARQMNDFKDVRSTCDQEVSNFEDTTTPQVIRATQQETTVKVLQNFEETRSLRDQEASIIEESLIMRPAKKRKLDRKSSVKLVPEEERIFDGLSFFYFPNNDTNKLRKRRIEKAQEFGVRWVRSLDGATHMIVDKHLQQKDIAKPLTAPHSTSLMVVNENYPVDCIEFRTLLNADQQRYQVPGTKNTKPQTELVPINEGSLQVKQARHRHASRRDRHDTVDDSNGFLGGHDTSGVKAIEKSAKRRESEPRDTTVDAKDELSEIIRYVHAYRRFLSDDEDSDADSSDARLPRSLSGKRGKEMALEDRFVCYSGGTKDKCSEQQNANARTIEVLQEMADFYASLGVEWKPQAYRRAIAMLRKQTNKMVTEEEARKVPGIGPRLASKIAEIAHTGSLEALQCERDDPQNQIREMFLKIYDIGVERANKWIARGFRTLDDVRTRAELTRGQRIGIDHYEDLNTRIPRAEVTALGEHVKREAARIDAAVELLIGGSYRRGSASSGDIDLLVTRKGTTQVADLVPFFQKLEKALTRQGFLVAELTGLKSNNKKDHGGGTWHGCCVLPQAPGDKPAPWRRIDFLLVPETEFGAALIYFTGNDIFNRSMRLLARKKGMRLNQRGLYHGVLRDARGKKLNEGELAEGRNEKRIFELLGLAWRPPEQRWC